MKRTTALTLTAALLSFIASTAQSTPSETTILKWKEGKKACFMLSFDDSAPSQLKNVIPELEKRKIVGTFYLVTGNSLYAALKPKWEAAAKSPSVVVANHTFTHKGVNNAAELDPELAKCNEVLYKLHPERKQPYLLAFGKPGGVPWKVTDDELQAALSRHHLVNRPPFFGPPIHYKSAAEVIAAVDKALATGDMGHLDFHGVGGDWLVTPMEWFTALLDHLEKNRDQLWITDTASWHKYVKERESAEAKVLENDKRRIRIVLTSKADPTLYDEPLTLSTAIPADWKSCTITQGANTIKAAVHDGAVQYSALPAGGEINIQPE
jgi:polysaccharide deacetylase